MPQCPLVSSEWLARRIEQSGTQGLSMIDASWHLPGSNRDAQAEFLQQHIPGAVFFDIDEHSAPSHLPHMLPEFSVFAKAMQSLGVAADDTLVIYDAKGLFSAARLWWMCRHFGLPEVFILDGGLPAWQRSGGSCVAQQDDSATSEPSATNDTLIASWAVIGERYSKNEEEGAWAVTNTQAVKAASENATALILDARGAGRFSGKEKEVRPGLRSGHIPGSVNLPFTELLDEQGLMKSGESLRALFEQRGVQRYDQLISSCGSGVTAAIIIAALHCAGYDLPIALYDGSWTEWGGRDDTRVAVL